VGAGTIVMVVLLALMRYYVRPSVGQLLIVQLSWMDFATDVLFIAALCDPRGDLTLGALAILGLLCTGLASLGLGLFVAVRATQQERAKPSSSDLDLPKLLKYQNVYAAVLLLSFSNASILVLLPWRSKRCGGFPSFRLLWATVMIPAVEAFWQLLLQIAFLSQPGHSTSAILIAVISLVFSMASLFMRILRKSLVTLVVWAGGDLSDRKTLVGRLSTVASDAEAGRKSEAHKTASECAGGATLPSVEMTSMPAEAGPGRVLQSECGEDEEQQQVQKEEEEDISLRLSTCS
jgi:hypothetical protein